MELNSQRAQFFFCDPLTNTYTSLLYENLLNPLSDILFEFLNKVWSEMQPLYCEEFFEASHSRKESVHKIARQEIEGLAQLLKIYIGSLKYADLNEEEIYDSLTL